MSYPRDPIKAIALLGKWRKHRNRLSIYEQQASVHPANQAFIEVYDALENMVSPIDTKDDTAQG